MASVMAFVRYCQHHKWIDRAPRIEKLDADDVMKGRPITSEEFERLLNATPKVVGAGNRCGCLSRDADGGDAAHRLRHNTAILWCHAIGSSGRR